MKFNPFKYFSTLVVFTLALLAGVVDVELLHAGPLDAGWQSAR